LQSGLLPKVRGLASSRSIETCSASSVTSTSSAPTPSAWRITTATVRPASSRLWGMFEIRFAPWFGPITNAFGKPWTWMPCRLRMPSAQCSKSVRPSRPITSKPARRV